MFQSRDTHVAPHHVLLDLMADEAAAHEASPPPAAAASEEEKARRSFLDFMTKVTQYEDLVDAGKRFLVKFHQELEHFRRPKLPMESGAVSELVKSNYTDRIKSYLEAGCNLQHQSIRNINQLHSCEEKLGDHINKGSDHFHGDDNLTNDCCEDEQQPGHQLDSAVSYASVMILVHNMLKLDYTMQEKIVKALCLKTSSSELEGYCQMWDVRPYVDDNVMQLAWKFVP